MSANEQEHRDQSTVGGGGKGFGLVLRLLQVFKRNQRLAATPWLKFGLDERQAKLSSGFTFRRRS